jgi:uncharacterized protein (TIGR02646 family)
MIRVEPRPEPQNFDSLVRQPGYGYLSTRPNPSAKEWNKHSYWRRILKELHSSYKGICAYSCHWIPYDTGADTVEHFLPKTRYPMQAYEWSNYRLVCATLNSRKGDFEDVLDPFQIEDGWFTIDFPSLLVKPSKNLKKAQSDKVRLTIERLGLNDEDTCVKSRERYIKSYCLNDVSFDYLLLDAPFIAAELRRQNLVDSIKEIMNYASL